MSENKYLVALSALCMTIGSKWVYEDLQCHCEPFLNNLIAKALLAVFIVWFFCRDWLAAIVVVFGIFGLRSALRYRQCDPSKDKFKYVLS